MASRRLVTPLNQNLRRWPLRTGRRWQHSDTTQSELLLELSSRGFIGALTSPKLNDAVSAGPMCLYSGCDPSARSLHVGNLLPLLCLLHFKQAGHHVLALIGGATGSIGDPSGRSTERNFLDPNELNANITAITKQVTRFFERGQEYASSRRKEQSGRGRLDVVNNLDWTREIKLLDFLRDVGKRAKVNTMLARDSVRNRLDSEQGISFTEFSYQLLQANDFKYLNDTYNCQLQVGGTDQWGNIVAGIDMIKRSRNAANLAVTEEEQEQEGGDHAYGLTIPLLTTSSGEKFGKSAGNAVWLDEGMTSVFDFYQYFLRSTDADVAKLLRLFTLLSIPQIEELVNAHQSAPKERNAQRMLASEITELVHGKEALKYAKTATSVLFDSDLASLDPEIVRAAFKGDGRLVEIGAEDVGELIVRLAAQYGLAKSRSDANRALKSGGLYLNGNKVAEAQRTLVGEDLVGGKFVVLGMGKVERKILFLRS